MYRLPTLIFLLLITAMIGGCSRSKKSGSASGADSTMIDQQADTSKKNLDEPDPEFDTLLAAQPQVQPQDTAFANLALTIDDEKVPLATYVAAQSFKHNRRGFASMKPSAQILRLAALPENKTVLFDFFVKLRISANELCAMQNFPDDKPGDPNWPHQDKIGYSWGAKDFEKRQKPCDVCTYKIHGLDCSGFFYRIFKKYGIDFSKTINDAKDERKPRNIEKALQPYFGDLKIHATDSLGASDFQFGDIVYFLNYKSNEVSHIGIVLENLEGKLSFYATRAGTDCTTQGCCLKNLSSGPQINPLTNIVRDSRCHGIVRLSTD